MELPHIGEHCSYGGCNQLDFLPVTCNLCKNKFCNEHHKYEDHSCPESYKVDVQVPVCPLCEKPVPSKRGLAPDLAVNEHMENNCQSKSKKIYNNKCSAAGCKVKEVVSIKCDSCQLNFCLRHRLSVDHDCQGPAAARRSLTLNGSIFRNWMQGPSKGSSQSSKGMSNPVRPSKEASNRSGISQSQRTPRGNVSILQGNMSEEEALQRALAESCKDNSSKQEPENTDEDLARAIALSLETQQSSKPKTLDCSVS